jgi:hypothetical protein
LHCNALQHITQRHFLNKEAASPSDLKYHQERTDSDLGTLDKLLLFQINDCWSQTLQQTVPSLHAASTTSMCTATESPGS